MDKIPVKQVEGAMDLVTDQRTESTKSFKGIIVSPDSTSGPFMQIDGNFIYWLKHENIFDEIGNVRVGALNGVLVIESYNDVWASI